MGRHDKKNYLLFVFQTHHPKSFSLELLELYSLRNSVIT